jgi:hypothetical protein
LSRCWPPKPNSRPDTQSILLLLFLALSQFYFYQSHTLDPKFFLSRTAIIIQRQGRVPFSLFVCVRYLREVLLLICIRFSSSAVPDFEDFRAIRSVLRYYFLRVEYASSGSSRQKLINVYVARCPWYWPSILPAFVISCVISLSSKNWFFEIRSS